MCGINGIVYSYKLTNNNDIISQINRMNNEIIHRGPDDKGIYIHENRIALGMRRLSIIDLKSKLLFL